MWCVVAAWCGHRCNFLKRKMRRIIHHHHHHHHHHHSYPLLYFFLFLFLPPSFFPVLLRPDRSAVLAVGRHEDSHVQVSDPRASMLHFEIFTTSVTWAATRKPAEIPKRQSSRRSPMIVFLIFWVSFRKHSSPYYTGVPFGEKSKK